MEALLQGEGKPAFKASPPAALAASRFALMIQTKMGERREKQ